MKNFATESPTRSPEPDSKRLKVHQKPKKTRYFFQPQNTLAYNPHRQKLNDSTVPPASSHSRLPPVKADAFQPPLHPNHESFVIPSATNNIPQHSSDDSFEGVRWRSGNTPNRRIDTRSLLSSPLKNHDLLQGSVQHQHEDKLVSNDVVDSVLSKYGVNFQNAPAETPKNPRSQSDEGLHTLNRTSPSLQRSKSFDPKSANKHLQLSPSSSRLNTWIDRFATNLPHPSGTSSPQPPKAEPETLTTATNNKKEEDSEDDDPFSDDDTLLAGLRADSFPPLTQIPPPSTACLQDEQKPPTTADIPPNSADVLPTIAVNSETTDKPPSLVDGESLLGLPKQCMASLPHEDSDPFSDDLDVSEIEHCAVKEQTPPVSNEEQLLNELLQEKRPFKEESGAKLSFSRSDFQRYQIISVLPLTYTTQQLRRKQLILTVKNKDDQESKLIVRGEAAELSLAADDIIHVILTSTENPRLIDNTNNLLIWNPDVLISSTVVADQLFCPRKTVLMKRLSFPGESTLPLLIGTIVHEIFQACFISERSDPHYLEQLLRAEIQKRLIEIYSIGDVVDELESKIREHLPFITNWFKAFYKTSCQEVPTNKRNEKIKFSVSEALDIEESVWSPMFGIKGNADVTLKANFVNERSLEQVLLPMEIKTSAQYLSHQAQAALYSLLFKDRYNFDISSFLLVYTLDDASTKKYDISVADLKSLVNLRNRISYFLRNGQRDLPDLMRQQKCDRCMIQQSCMTLNYMTESGTAEDSGLKEGVYEDLTHHLKDKPHYTAYFKYWNELLSQEEHFMTRFNKDLWVLSAQERETDQGKALADLIIKSFDDDDDNRLLYTFAREPNKQGRSMDSTQILKYDKVIVSDQNGHFALSQGYVVDISATHITITTRRRIILTSLKTDKFHRANVLRRSSSQLQSSGDAVVFRLDKDEMFYGMGIARFNLLNLFLVSGDERRRRLIVDLDLPRFGDDKIEWKPEQDHFNPDQRRAVERVLQCKDYSLILGMPGTGKTTLIAHLIKMLTERNKTVLLASYTNSAVDNILLKAKDLEVDFLRIGNPSRVHHDIRRFVPGQEGNKVSSYQEFQNAFVKPKVVAATCLSIRDFAFNIRDHFDYCIIDEASQVSMPLSLGPLRFCDKFVLVGDHYQLPPLVTHPNALVKKGLSQSLFETLAQAHPQSVTELTYQYRMCEDIMSLSNQLIYDNRLKCGSEKVVGRKLQISVENLELIDRKQSASWLHEALVPETKCVFFNHDPIYGIEKVTGENISNETEVELIRQTIEGLCACGVPEKSIGVVTLYRSQLKLLNEAMRHRSAIEILTADRFQGRDKECIIISLVRSNKENKVGDLIKDWRRINVAVTRAMSKLIIFGSVSTLSAAPTIREFVEVFRIKGWIHNLPANAKGVYDLPAANQRTNPTGKENERSQRSVRKLGNKVMGTHPLVKDILMDMNVNRL